MDKLEQLAQLEGFESEYDLLDEYALKSVVPGICAEPLCDYVGYYEPDQDQGWCELCNKGSVVSCLILAGIM